MAWGCWRSPSVRGGVRKICLLGDGVRTPHPSARSLLLLLPPSAELRGSSTPPAGVDRSTFSNAWPTLLVGGPVGSNVSSRWSCPVFTALSLLLRAEGGCLSSMSHLALRPPRCLPHRSCDKTHTQTHTRLHPRPQKPFNQSVTEHQKEVTRPLYTEYVPRRQTEAMQAARRTAHVHKSTCNSAKLVQRHHTVVARRSTCPCTAFFWAGTVQAGGEIDTYSRPEKNTG